MKELGLISCNSNRLLFPDHLALLPTLIMVIKFNHIHSKVSFCVCAVM